MGAGLPPNPTVTSILVGAPNPVLLPKLPVDELPNPPPRGCEPKEVVTGEPSPDCGACPGIWYVEPTFDGKLIPPLLAPPSFSCVRP